MTETTTSAAQPERDAPSATVLCVEVVRSSTPAAADERLERIKKTLDQAGAERLEAGRDELLVVFDDAGKGVQAASRLSSADSSARLRIGVHIGATHREQAVFGEGPLVAGAVARVARPGQALCTEDTVVGLPQDVSWLAREVDGLALPGLHARVPLFELVEEHDSLESAPPTVYESHAPAYARLELMHGAHVYVCDAERAALTLGRTSANDVVVRSDLTSRRHARIELRGGQFILEDSSANGTLVISETGESVAVRREESPLHDAGLLCLGGTADKNPKGLLRFKCFA